MKSAGAMPTNRLLVGLACSLIVILAGGCGRSKVIYTVEAEEGGGYVLNIRLRTRHFQLLSSEGMFPVETGTYRIRISGKGKDWSYKGRKGLYYSPSLITSDQQAWDYCYAWVDLNREYLYLNAYWLDPPTRMIPSLVARKYLLRAAER